MFNKIVNPSKEKFSFNSIKVNFIKINVFFFFNAVETELKFVAYAAFTLILLKFNLHVFNYILKFGKYTKI